MSTVKFSWVNGGEEFELGDMPIAGHREINERKRRYAKTIAAWTESLKANRANIMLITKKILAKSGLAKAMEFWKAGLSQMGSEGLAKELDWPVEQFELNLNAWIEDEVYKWLGVSTFEDARSKLDEKAKSLDMAALQDEGQDFYLDIFLLELFWRLRWQFSELQMPDGSRAPLTTDNLAKVAKFPADAKVFYAATRENEKVNYREELAVKTEEVVRKNSQTSAASSTPSKPGSPSTSTNTTAPEPKSVSVTR